MKKSLRVIFRSLYSLPFGLGFTKRMVLSDLEKTLLGFRTAGFFKESGWIASWEKKMPQSENGEPSPWFTYSANRFLAERLKKDMVAFEYGSGNSTLFLGPRVKKLTSLEHKPDWFSNIDPHPYENTRIILCQLDDQGSYPNYPKNLGEKFDLIIVDGRRRNDCLMISTELLSERGVVILDDSQRERYEDGMKTMKDRGFKRLDFYGLSLGDYVLKATSIFYRTNNCLGI